MRPQEIKRFSGLLIHLWLVWSEILRVNSKQLLEFYKRQHEDTLDQLSQTCTISRVQIVEKYSLNDFGDEMGKNSDLAKEIRNSEEYLFNSKVWNDQKVVSKRITKESCHQVVLFEEFSLNRIRFCPEMFNLIEIERQFREKYSPLKDYFSLSPINLNQGTTSNSESDQFPSRKHLVFMVHGMQGSPADLVLLKSFLQYKNPDIMVYICEGHTESKEEESIQELSAKVCDEILLFLVSFEEYHINTDYMISFLGFSLGGILIREFLSKLHEYKEKMLTYMSVSTPHLGTGTSNSTIFNFGTRR